MQYHTCEMNHALRAPLRAQGGVLRRVLDLPFNAVGGLPWARATAAACGVFEGLTRRYGKPEWGIESTRIFGLEVPVREEVVHRTPFCDLLQRHALPDRRMMHRGEKVDCAAIADIALMTVEGEKARRTTSAGSGRSRRHTTCARTCRSRCATITCSRGSGIMACSTARAGAPRSSRGSAR